MSGPHFDFEREAMAQGLRWVAGVDEVGRGPLAGPVDVAAVILDPEDLPEGLDDSNALCEAKSDALRPAIFAKAISVSIVSRAPRRSTSTTSGAPSCAPWRRPCARSASGRIWRCSTAATFPMGSAARRAGDAKTTRDALMRDLARESPRYGFADHVGYATAFHRRALAASGPAHITVARSGWRRTLFREMPADRQKLPKRLKKRNARRCSSRTKTTQRQPLPDNQTFTTNADKRRANQSVRP